MFSESSPCLQGQHGSCSTAQQPGELSEIILQNLLKQVAAPPGTLFFVSTYLTKEMLSIGDVASSLHVETMMITELELKVWLVGCFMVGAATKERSTN